MTHTDYNECIKLIRHPKLPRKYKNKLGRIAGMFAQGLYVSSEELTILQEARDYLYSMN